MSQKRSITRAFPQSAKNYKLGIGDFINRIAIMKDPYPVNKPAKDVIKLFYIFNQTIVFNTDPLLNNLFWHVNY